MPPPNVIVLRAPGTNCDVETAHAFESCGAKPERVHLFRVLERPEMLKDFQILCVPGGFSYGDDVGARPCREQRPEVLVDRLVPFFMIAAHRADASI